MIHYICYSVAENATSILQEATQDKSSVKLMEQQGLWQQGSLLKHKKGFDFSNPLFGCQLLALSRNVTLFIRLERSVQQFPRGQ